jgi:hypothetical protein
MCLQDDAYERENGPCLALRSPGGRVTSRFEERVKSRVRLGVVYIVQDMYSFLSEYFSTIVLAPHAIRCRVAQAV